MSGLDHFPVGVGLGAVLPGEQTHAPGEPEDTGSGQVDVPPRVHSQFVRLWRVGCPIPQVETFSLVEMR